MTESVELENKLKQYLELSDPTVGGKAKETLEKIAKEFDATWLSADNKLNDKAEYTLPSITREKLQVGQTFLVDVMELTSSDGTADTILKDRVIFLDSYVDPGPNSGDPYCWARRAFSSLELEDELNNHSRNGAELYAGTFQKDGKKYAAMVTIMKRLSR